MAKRRKKISVFGDDGHVRLLDDVLITAITEAVNDRRGTMQEVAQGLGMGLSTLYKKLCKNRPNSDHTAG